MQRVLEETARLREADLFIGDSELIRRLKDQIRQMAEYPVNVLDSGGNRCRQKLVGEAHPPQQPLAQRGPCDVHCGSDPRQSG